MKTYQTILLIFLFIALPIVLYFTGDFPQRSVLMECLSMMTLISYFIMILQFFLSRVGLSILHEYKMSKMVKWHKTLGYIFTGILFLHPLFIIVPRYYDSGLDPINAFLLIINQYDTNFAIASGLLAWALMLVIGLTAFFRSNLGMSYKTWRIFHGILSILFVLCADWHILKLGRHMNGLFIVSILFLSVMACLLILNSYLSPRKLMKKSS